eukprot:s1927_g3.t1
MSNGVVSCWYGSTWEATSSLGSNDDLPVRRGSRFDRFLGTAESRKRRGRPLELRLYMNHVLLHGFAVDRGTVGHGPGSTVSRLTVFDRNVDETKLPTSLKVLSFGRDFNQKLERVTLPPDLRELKLGNGFNRPLETVKLPSSLERLTLGEQFSQSLETVKFPRSLKVLKLMGIHWPNLDAADLPDLDELQCRGITVLRAVKGIKGCDEESFLEALKALEVALMEQFPLTGELEGEFQEEAKLAVEAKAKELSSLLSGSDDAKDDDRLQEEDEVEEKSAASEAAAFFAWPRIRGAVAHVTKRLEIRMKSMVKARLGSPDWIGLREN